MRRTWVRTADELPEIGERVLIWPLACIAMRCENDASWQEDASGWHWEGDGEGLVILNRVTHWHPLSGPEEQS